VGRLWLRVGLWLRLRRLPYDRNLRPAKGTSVVVKPPADIQKLPSYGTVVAAGRWKVLIAGGSYDNGFSTSNATLIFDPASGGVSKGPLMAKPRQEAMATLLEDGRVLIIGGDYFDGIDYHANNNAELIDPSHPLSKSILLVSQDLTNIHACSPTDASSMREGT